MGEEKISCTCASYFDRSPNSLARIVVIMTFLSSGVSLSFEDCDSMIVAISLEWLAFAATNFDECVFPSAVSFALLYL